MLFLLVLIFLFYIIRSLLRSFLRNTAGTLINPLFWLLLYSIFYLLLPLLYVDFAIEATGLSFEAQSIHKAYIWSIWYVLIFYLFYLKSSPIVCEFSDLSPSVTAYKCSLVVYWVILLLLILIILLYVPSIYAVREDRGAALNLYEVTINSRFKLRILIYCHYITMFILFWKDTKLRWLLPCILYILIDYSHGGRTVSLMTLTFCYFLVVLKYKRIFLLLILVCVMSLIFLGVLQRSTSTDFIWQLYMAGAEFSNTYLTTIYLSENDILFDGWSYFVVSLSKIFPGGVVDKLLGFGEWYGNDLSECIGLGYGLAGNIITEALIYGGPFFSFFQPIFIGLFCLLINRMKWRKSLFGFLYTLLISVSMQNVVRSYFWGFILYPISILIFYQFYLYNDYRKNIFK